MYVKIRLRIDYALPRVKAKVIVTTISYYVLQSITRVWNQISQRIIQQDYVKALLGQNQCYLKKIGFYQIL